MTERIKFNDFEPPAEVVGKRAERDLGKEYGGHSTVIDGLIELEGGIRVHSDNPNLEVIYDGGDNK